MYHPHVHMLVAGGALAPDGSWRPAPGRRKRYLVPNKALGKLFAGKFLDAARRALPADVPIPNIAVGTKWVVFVKPCVQGRGTVLRYLGRYVRRTAIAEGNILACSAEHVTFRYRDSRTHERKTMTLPPHEFLRRFLQHVLPKGLHRVRAYGLLSSTHRTTLRRLQLLLGADAQQPDSLDVDDHEDIPRLRCPRCRQGALVVIPPIPRTPKDGRQCPQGGPDGTEEAKAVYDRVQGRSGQAGARERQGDWPAVTRARPHRVLGAQLGEAG